MGRWLPVVISTSCPGAGGPEEPSLSAGEEMDEHARTRCLADQMLTCPVHLISHVGGDTDLQSASVLEGVCFPGLIFFKNRKLLLIFLQVA